MPKIFISTIPFGEIDPTPVEMLKEIGWEFKINPLGRKLTPEEVGEFAKDADGLIAGTEDINIVMEMAKKLKIIARVGIGLDSVPLKKCREQGITVTYTPNALTIAVAEITIGVMITVTRHVHHADKNIRKNIWKRPVGKRIGDSIVGLIGLGRIGSDIARLLVPFEPKEILVFELKDKAKTVESLRQEYGLNIRLAGKDELFAKSDIVSLHIPLTPMTKNMIDREALSLFKRDAFLINFARGGIVNEDDLYEFLKEGRIAGAAMDCFEKEPYHGNLRELDNVLLTPHIGSSTFDCRARMEIQAVEDVIHFFRNESLANPVPPVEYEYQES